MRQGTGNLLREQTFQCGQLPGDCRRPASGREGHARVSVKTGGDGRSRMMANFQPGTSSIDTYNNLFTES